MENKHQCEGLAENDLAIVLFDGSEERFLHVPTTPPMIGWRLVEFVGGDDDWDNYYDLCVAKRCPCCEWTATQEEVRQ